MQGIQWQAKELWWGGFFLIFFKSIFLCQFCFSPRNKQSSYPHFGISDTYTDISQICNPTPSLLATPPARKHSMMTSVLVSFMFSAETTSKSLNKLSSLSHVSQHTCISFCIAMHVCLFFNVLALIYVVYTSLSSFPITRSSFFPISVLFTLPFQKLFSLSFFLYPC